MAQFTPQELEPTTAQCNCGAVKLTLSRPQLTLACYCHDCRGRTGAPAAFMVMSRGDDVTIVAEEGQITSFGKKHPDGKNKVCFVLFHCAVHVHVCGWGGWEASSQAGVWVGFRRLVGLAGKKK
jgi:hypothetical protein